MSAVVKQLPVLCGTGRAGTPMAAFHQALTAVGLAQYNLIRLSSVIPPGTTIDGTGCGRPPAGTWGDRLYCVYAEQRAEIEGEEAWTGLGWVQRRGGGGGFLVEHEGASEDFVRNAIATSLRDMVRDCAEEFTPPDLVLNGARCTTEPVCSLVIAPFAVLPW